MHFTMLATDQSMYRTYASFDLSKVVLDAENLRLYFWSLLAFWIPYQTLFQVRVLTGRQGFLIGADSQGDC